MLSGAGAAGGLPVAVTVPASLLLLAAPGLLPEGLGNVTGAEFFAGWALLLVLLLLATYVPLALPLLLLLPPGLMLDSGFVLTAAVVGFGAMLASSADLMTWCCWLLPSAMSAKGSSMLCSRC